MLRRRTLPVTKYLVLVPNHNDRYSACNGQCVLTSSILYHITAACLMLHAITVISPAYGSLAVVHSFDDNFGISSPDGPLLVHLLCEISVT
jgi:hypothetical protein